MNTFDRRLTPARADLAAAHLSGAVKAPRYAEGRLLQVRDAAIPLRRMPTPDGAVDTEALLGETATVYEEEEGFAWCQLTRDGYVGYLAANGLGPAAAPATHRISVPRTFVYPGPDPKLPPLMTLSMGARLRVTGTQGAFSVTPQGAVFTTHLAALADHAPDFVSVAEMFLHTPYLWGGKTGIGLDCSGLAQVALDAAGIAAPRDSDMQEKALGRPLAHEAPGLRLRRGDLVFWKGHVGIMRDAETLLHANGHHMLVVSEPLAEARARILAKSHGPVTSIRRL